MIAGIVRAAVIYKGTDPNKALEFKQLGSAGTRLGITAQSYAVAQDDELADTFPRIASTQSQAVLVLADAFTIFHRQRLAELALEWKLPSVRRRARRRGECRSRRRSNETLILGAVISRS